ncbi:hypothetical protein FB451DRAFT_1413388 [Mycena latifolia]|nr:hypothetical protein FB451DRAFT_1413388 [Mycena latifolia]
MHDNRTEARDRVESARSNDIADTNHAASSPLPQITQSDILTGLSPVEGASSPNLNIRSDSSLLAAFQARNSESPANRRNGPSANEGSDDVRHWSALGEGWRLPQSAIPVNRAQRATIEAMNLRVDNAKPVRQRAQEKATVEEVSDEEDQRASRRSHSQSVAGSRRSRGTNNLPHAVVPPTPARSHVSSRSHRSASVQSLGLPSSSPYPIGTEDQTDALSITNTERFRRREGKQRRNRAESIESDELRQATALSIAEMQRAMGGGAEGRPNAWDDQNVKAAMASLARERGENESSEEFQRRRAVWARNEAQLRDLRIADDRVVAAALLQKDANELADREFAMRIDQAEREHIQNMMGERNDTNQSAVVSPDAELAALEHTLAEAENEARALEAAAAEKRAETDRRATVIAEYLQKKSHREKSRTWCTPSIHACIIQCENYA